MMDTEEGIDLDPYAEADEELYGDLFTGEEGGEGNILMKQENAQLKEELHECTTERDTLKRKVHELEAQVAELSEERETLARNISCLFKTAVRESARKDGQIAEMRKKQYLPVAGPSLVAGPLGLQKRN